MDVNQLRMKLKAEQARQMLKMKQAELLSAPKPQDEVTDAMPEWLQSSDRAVVKNLSNNDEETLKYLSGKYPDAEFKKGADGEIIARKSGEKTYGKLDPSFSPFSNPIGTLKDLGNDITDIGYDAAQGVSEAVGAGAGALGGGLAGAATGNPAAVAAGLAYGGYAGAGTGAGAASTAKELLRKKFGLTDEISGKNIATDAALGALIPAGIDAAGVGIKNLVTKAIPKGYGYAVGRTPEQLKRLADQGDNLASKSSDEALQSIEGLADNFGKAVKTEKKRVGSMYKTSGDMNVTPVVDKIDAYIADLQNLVNQNPTAGAFKEKLQNALAWREKNIGKGVYPKKMNIESGMRLRGELADQYLPTFKEDAGQWVGKGVSAADEDLTNIARRGLKEQANLATGGQIAGADSEFIKLSDIADFGRDYLGSPKKTLATLKKLAEGADDELLGRFQRLPENIQKMVMDGKQDKELFDYLKGINKKRVITDQNLGSEALQKVVGQTPVEKAGAFLGGLGGYLSGTGYAGSVGGALAGRGAGKVIANPKNVLRVAKTGKRVGKGMAGLEKLIQDNPELKYILYGAGDSLTQ